MMQIYHMFGIEFDTSAWISLSIAVVASVMALITRFIPIWRTAQTAKLQRSEAENISFTEADRTPFLSVIVYTFITEEPLNQYLDSIMNQDYPNYEVIIVNEGGAEVTEALAERLLKKYPEHLYITFIPNDSHNLSRRKLAHTIGMKAAKGDVVLTTTANCKIPSKSWLSLMMQPFCNNSITEVVLGYSHMEFSSMTGAWKWYREFDHTLTACQWLGAAIHHQPYRGDGFNLAYRKHHFFDQKGYSKTLHLMNGDDDLFINDISDNTNTDVMIAPEAILSYDWSESSNHIMAEIKERYQFTARMLPKAPFLRAGTGSLMQWISFIAAVTGAIIGLPDLLPLTIAVLLLLLLNGSEILIYRRAARALGSVCLWWALPFFLLWHPIGNFLFRYSNRRHYRKHFTFT